ncbi:hypothetical protein SteCoe_7687 [Stentor coeruleus]|uniref:Spindle assembly abnormal protein 6 N-terminal domain-containing protein n=1 Tax=Stentor coeruleus TaxID=5963 RepID=A0A1R2CM41_9CILI|nr:hypothetical protein SteCoe_7687 [Stentor coeruleus]
MQDERLDRVDSILNSFDFSAIEDMDPSLSEGHHVSYDREVPLELRIQDSNSGPQEVGTLESIKTKLLVLGEDSNPRHIKLELTSENDIFFHYINSIDEAAFNNIQQSQKLMIEFSELPTILVRMLNACIKEPHSFLAVLVMHRDGRARLDFIQNIEYKFIELLSLDFVATSEELVRQQITFRYNTVKSKTAVLQARLQDISALVKVKNPSLLLQLQKNPKKSVNK